MIKLLDEKMKGVEYPVGNYMQTNKVQILRLIALYKSITEFQGRGVNIICRGASGVIVATIFSMQLEVPNKIINIRKPREDAHYTNDSIISNINSEWVNLIVDDFISTGQTINYIYDELRQKASNTFFPIEIDCVAVTGADNSNLLKFQPKYFLSSNTQ